MAEKNRLSKKAREAKQEKKAKMVIYGIISALIILGIIYVCWSAWLVS